MPPTFIFLCHGETEANIAFNKEGISAFKEEVYMNTRLTPLGLEQARAAGKALSHLQILDIISSPLERCIQTVEQVCKEIHCQRVCLDDRLLERNGNYFPLNKRKSKSELIIQHPTWNLTCLPDYPCYWATTENDESLYARNISVILNLIKSCKNYDDSMYILIVGHAEGIRSITARSLNYGEHCILKASEIS